MIKIKKIKPKRTYTGEKWKTNQTNKKYLAEDFHYRCAYCDDFEKYNGGYRAYHVEHFAPKTKFPELEFTYDNLLYVCPYCNSSKSDKWPSSDSSISVVGDKGFLDPCEDDYYNHLHREIDGSIGYSTPLGEYIYKELKLYLKRHKLIYRTCLLDEIITELGELIDAKKEKKEDVSQLEKLESLLLKEYRNNIKATASV